MLLLPSSLHRRVEREARGGAEIIARVGNMSMGHVCVKRRALSTRARAAWPNCE